MLHPKRTAKNGTITSEGFIEHKEHPLGYSMPVLLIIRSQSPADLDEPQRPKRTLRGQYMYALPGGGIWRG